MKTNSKKTLSKPEGLRMKKLFNTLTAPKGLLVILLPMKCMSDNWGQQEQTYKNYNKSPTPTVQVCF